MITECACKVCECYVEVEEGDTLCLGCLHGAHPGEVE